MSLVTAANAAYLVAALLFTDVGRDGLLKGCNVAATAALHAAGYALVRFLPQAAAPLVRLAGLASAGAGVWLLAG